jgi:hypothetical protein
MNFKWMTEQDGDMFRSLKGLVNNGGFFKSSGQAAFFEKRVKDGCPHIGPCTAWDNSVVVVEGQYAIICEGLIGITGDDKSWGSRSRRKAWIFLCDEVGVVAMFIGRCKHYSDGSAPNGEKTVREFIRNDDGRAQELAKAWADPRIAFKLKAKFTVKSHEEYNGQKQTVVNRPKLIERESLGVAA